MPTPEEVEVAHLFLRKAASDLSAARALARDPDQHDDVVGFHAQQAIEKSLKAVLAARSSEIPRTHDLDLLTRLVAPDPGELPNELSGAKELSPWAVATQAVADEVLQTADRRAYSDGVRVLKKAAKAAHAAGRDEIFSAHIARLREQYRRRPTLIAMLDKAGFA